MYEKKIDILIAQHEILFIIDENNTKNKIGKFINNNEN